MASDPASSVRQVLAMAAVGLVSSLLGVSLAEYTDQDPEDRSTLRTRVLAAPFVGLAAILGALMVPTLYCFLWV